MLQWRGTFYTLGQEKGKKRKKEDNNRKWKSEGKNLTLTMLYL